VRHKLPTTILITGATGAIGTALAVLYAGPATTLILLGRSETGLAELAARCRDKGSRIITQALDLRDRTALMERLGQICSAEQVDLAIVNAGVNTNIGPDGGGESWEAVQELLEVNIVASLATVHAILPAMRQRGSGQIALISSLAAYYGLPLTPSYSASKAAIKAYGEALRGWLATEGIRVNVVMPGYVASRMCHDMPGPKPFLWTAERAARTISRGLAADRPRISFPFPLNLGCWLLSVIHPSLAQRILQLLNYHA
jgi:short-subunit dehydrogenase